MVVSGDLPQEEPPQAAHDGGAGGDQKKQEHDRLKAQGADFEKFRQNQHAQSRTYHHSGEHGEAQFGKGNAHMVQRQEAHGDHHEETDGAQLLCLQTEGRSQQTCDQHQNQIGQTARQGF